MNLPETLTERPAVPAPASLDVIHRWILHRTSALAAELDAALVQYRFDVAADRLYHFFWHEYADWYIELVKPALQSEGVARDAAVAVLLEVHDRVLRMLHPFIPFVTEEIWQALPQRPDDGRPPAGRGQTITLSAFPVAEAAWSDDEAVAVMGLLQDVVTTVRTVRSEWGVPPAKTIAAMAQGAADATVTTLRTHVSHIVRLAGLTALEFADEVPRSPDTVRRVVRDFEVHVPLAGIVDRAKETERVTRDLAKLVKQRGALQATLANDAFLSRADPDVVRDRRVQERDVGQRQTKLEQILAELST